MLSLLYWTLIKYTLLLLSEELDKDLELGMLDAEEQPLTLSFLSLLLKVILPMTESSAMSILKTEAIFEALVLKAEE